MDGIEVIDSKTDLVYSPDDGCYYFQQFKHDGPLKVEEFVHLSGSTVAQNR